MKYLLTFAAISSLTAAQMNNQVSSNAQDMCMEKNKYCGHDPNDMNVQMLSLNSLYKPDLSEDTCADWCTRQ